MAKAFQSLRASEGKFQANRPQGKKKGSFVIILFEFVSTCSNKGSIVTVLAFRGGITILAARSPG